MEIFIIVNVNRPIYVTRYKKEVTNLINFTINYSTCVENGYFK